MGGFRDKISRHDSNWEEDQGKKGPARDALSWYKELVDLGEQRPDAKHPTAQIVAIPWIPQQLGHGSVQLQELTITLPLLYPGLLFFCFWIPKPARIVLGPDE